MYHGLQQKRFLNNQMSSNETQAYTYTYTWCLSREPFRASSLDVPGKPTTNTLNWQLKQKFKTECS